MATIPLNTVTATNGVARLHPFNSDALSAAPDA